MRAAVLALTLTAGCSHAPDQTRAPQRPAASQLEDSLIHASLVSRYLERYPDDAARVHILVSDRVVTLLGTVRSAGTRDHMAADASETVHVRAVVDRLRIRNGPARERVHGAL